MKLIASIINYNSVTYLLVFDVFITFPSGYGITGIRMGEFKPYVELSAFVLRILSTVN